ncbi:hypothetical protein GGR32_002178 [Mesonia hippocampi]|uniref:DUF4293 family protein n=2 Tax=Mesonia hippocampi TaxID=1628250 RepID=A0A840EYG9_9FLAO|nr:hypothetical protein [Mesonia hippocampi]
MKIFFLKIKAYICDETKKVMIQRIQSIYLLIVVLLGSVLPFIFPLWTTPEGAAVYAIDVLLAKSIFIGSAFMALVSIFLFKNRQLQFVMGRLNIVSNFILLGFFVYWSLSLPGEMNISEKGIGMLIPILSIVFLVLANKAIKKDEALVKSVDRFR